MRKIMLALPLMAMALTGCETRDQTTAAGALTGAALGAAVSNKNDRVLGAAIGAAAGVAASTLVGPARTSGQCYYRRADGSRFIAACQ